MSCAKYPSKSVQLCIHIFQLHHQGFLHRHLHQMFFCITKHQLPEPVGWQNVIRPASFLNKSVYHPWIAQQSIEDCSMNSQVIKNCRQEAWTALEIQVAAYKRFGLLSLRSISTEEFSLWHPIVQQQQNKITSLNAIKGWTNFNLPGNESTTTSEAISMARPGTCLHRTKPTNINKLHWQLRVLPTDQNTAQGETWNLNLPALPH